MSFLSIIIIISRKKISLLTQKKFMAEVLAPFTSQSNFFTKSPTHKPGSFSQFLSSPPRRGFLSYTEAQSRSNPPSPTPAYGNTPKRPLTASSGSSSSKPGRPPRKLSRPNPPDPEISARSDTLLALASDHLVAAQEARIKDTINFRHNRLIEGLLERCTVPSNCITNDLLVGDDMGLRCREYLMGLVGQRPDDIVIGEWDIPALDVLIEYQGKALQRRENIHALGNWDGEALVTDGVGRVEVWNEEVDVFKNVGTMVVNYNSTVSTTIRVGVMGGIIGYATGVLIDVDGCMWFANAPGAIGNYLCGEEGQVMLIKKDDKSVKGTDDIKLLEVDDKVEFSFAELDFGGDEFDFGGDEDDFGGEDGEFE